MRTIEIDIDVHKSLEQARNSFRESENAILRRVLGIDGPSLHRPIMKISPDKTDASKRPWVGQNRKTGREVRLAHGTEARAKYRGQDVVAIIVNGQWQVAGALFDNPSTAVMENVRTKSGEKPSLSGWREWKVLAGSPPQWMRLVDL